MYDVIIVGGGIAGLHTAYKLQKYTKNICILEKDGRLGGRIYTVTKQGVSMEAGAGRFNQHHKQLLGLLDDLGISDQKVEIPSDVSFRPSNPKSYPKKYIDKDPFHILDSVFQKGKRTSKTKLQTQTFIEFAKSILREREDIQFILDSFGYYEQLIHMNAYDAIKLFDKGMHTKNTFYSMKNGMSTIIESLRKKLDCDIKTNVEVNNIQYESYSEEPKFIIHTNERKMPYYAKYCVCAIPKLFMEKLPVFKVIQSFLDNIGIKILCRIYAKFERNDIWFKDIPKTTTNNENRYIIPINRDEGLIMIAYTDSKYAEYWKSLPEKEVFSHLQKNIQSTFGYEISTPSFLQAFYWDTGTAFWKPNCNSDIVSKDLFKPIHSMPLYVCGENVSQTQGWIEGALETSTNVANTLKSFFNN